MIVLDIFQLLLLGVGAIVFWVALFDLINASEWSTDVMLRTKHTVAIGGLLFALAYTLKWAEALLTVMLR